MPSTSRCSSEKEVQWEIFFIFPVICPENCRTDASRRLFTSAIIRSTMWLIFSLVSVLNRIVSSRRFKIGYIIIYYISVSVFEVLLIVMRSDHKARSRQQPKKTVAGATTTLHLTAFFRHKLVIYFLFDFVYNKNRKGTIAHKVVDLLYG